jgi:hypothetical protein
MLAHWDGDRVFENSGQAILGGLPGIPTYFEKPYNRRVMNYYLSELLAKHTLGSTRTSAWMDMETAATAGTGITMTKDFYQSWFSSRKTTAESFIGSPLNASFAISTSPATTTANTITLSGTSPSSIYEVRVAGQPWAQSTWTTTTVWNLSGVILKTGVNLITVEGVNHEGLVVRTTTFTITKPGDAPPVMVLQGIPASFNVSLNEALDLDAAASWDPDGGALSFGWEVAPAADVALSTYDGLASAVFTRPGLYRFTATGTDSAASSSAIVREAAVFGRDGFSSFNEPRLEPFWQQANIGVIDNASDGPCYSLQEDAGHLLIRLPGERAYPLGEIGTTTHPWLKRELPATGDWVLQTDLNLTGMQFGSFMTGLMVEVESGASLSRYGFGYRNGNQLAVVQVGETGTPVSKFGLSYSLGSAMVVRIRRDGGDLVFEYRPDMAFEEVYRFALPEDASITAGGPFGATEASETLTVSFDYVMMIDPAPLAPPAVNLVISEVMYKPAGGENEEYLELHNPGPAAVNLAGFRFPQGEPFDEFVFGDVTISPGGYLLVVHNLAAFQARYGHSLDAIIAGEWLNGNLSNSGELITLLDAEGNTVISFTYGDLPPWPTLPDTNGTSLVLADPTSGDSSAGAAWTASSLVGGTPGGAELDPAFAAWMTARHEFNPLAIKPGEPVNNLLSYAFGLDLASGDAAVALPKFGMLTIGDDSFLTYEYRRRLNTPLLGYLVEISRNGRDWTDGTPDLITVGIAGEGDGTERVTVRLKNPLGSETLVLLRLRVTQIVANPGDAFAGWMAARGETDPFASKPGEPVNNLLSYAFGLDLASGDAAVALPQFGMLTIGDASFLSYEYRRRSGDPTISYRVEISRDGLQWHDGAADLVEVGVAGEGDGTERVTLRLVNPLSSEAVVLLRVRVMVP